MYRNFFKLSFDIGRICVNIDKSAYKFVENLHAICDTKIKGTVHS